MEKKGFTLIEILIVVAIIAILASIVLVGLGPTQQSGRDARRLSDLHEVQNGLELYYSACGFYPGTKFATCTSADDAAVAAGAVGNDAGYTAMGTALTTSASLGINTVPVDPSNSGSHLYYFATNGVAASTYILAAVLEDTNNTVFTSYVPPNPAAYTSGDKLVNTGVTTACQNPEYCISL